MTEKELNNIHIDFLNTIYSCIPKEWIEDNGYSDSSFYALLTSKNDAYKQSRYFYDGDKKFIHWTSVQNLMSIINNREIRLYNLQNSTDPEEFGFLAKQLLLSNERINHSKNYLYAFSFCNSEDLNNPDLWKQYGQNYKGVALEFEIINDLENWNNFMLSNVYYEVSSELIKLNDNLVALKIKYPGVNIDFDLGRLIAFFKHPIYLNEKEVRLSIYFPYNDIEAYWTHCNTEFRLDIERPRITDYFSLKLYVDNNSPFVKSDNPEFDRRLIVEEDYFLKAPQVRINNIYFGKKCGINKAEFSAFHLKLQEIIRHKLGYTLNLASNLFE